MPQHALRRRDVHRYKLFLVPVFAQFLELGIGFVVRRTNLSNGPTPAVRLESITIGNLKQRPNVTETKTSLQLFTLDCKNLVT